MQKQLIPIGKEKVKESIIAIGQELIKRADDITNDLEFVANIEILYCKCDVINSVYSVTYRDSL